MTAGTLTAHGGMTVRTNARAIAQLPQPGSHWRHRDLPDHLQARLKEFNRAGIIERIKRVKHHGEQFSVWATRQDAYQAAQRHRKQTPDQKTLPCGHTLAFKHQNSRIHCKHPGCEQSWPVDTIRPIIEGGDT